MRLFGCAASGSALGGLGVRTGHPEGGHLEGKVPVWHHPHCDYCWNGAWLLRPTRPFPCQNLSKDFPHRRLPSYAMLGRGHGGGSHGPRTPFRRSRGEICDARGPTARFRRRIAGRSQRYAAPQKNAQKNLPTFGPGGAAAPRALARPDRRLSRRYSYATDRSGAARKKGARGRPRPPPASARKGGFRAKKTQKKIKSPPGPTMARRAAAAGFAEIAAPGDAVATPRSAFGRRASWARRAHPRPASPAAPRRK
jgi:hypothetical protein